MLLKSLAPNSVIITRKHHFKQQRTGRKPRPSISTPSTPMAGNAASSRHRNTTPPRFSTPQQHKSTSSQQHQQRHHTMMSQQLSPQSSSGSSGKSRIALNNSQLPIITTTRLVPRRERTGARSVVSSELISFLTSRCG